MKDILQDVVAHTHALGFLALVKVSNDEGTTIDAMAEDRSVILSGSTHSPVAEFEGPFGMPNPWSTPGPKPQEQGLHWPPQLDYEQLDLPHSKQLE